MNLQTRKEETKGEKNIMKKFLALGLAMMMSVVALTGCGGGSEEPAEGGDAAATSGAISVVSREDGSGTRGAFEELLGLEDVCQYANELDSTGAVIAKVASTPGAIGYASLDAVDDTIIAAKLNGVEPTEENIKAGSYILSRPFVMATMGEVSAQSEPVQALFDYLKSDEGKQLIQSVGLITVD